MRVTKILTTSVTAAALAFSMLASAIPANAATTPGYHAAWVAQSAYATAAPGSVVQMSAVYQNTGNQPWIKGTAGQQANFGAGSAKDPAYPRDTTAYADAGWNTGQNWLTSNRFAAQANDLVATSALGSWVWSVKVPLTQATGVINFNGTPVVDGTAWMEDYGFFLQVTVTAGTVSVDSTTPPSPANNPNPAVNGSAAPAGGTVTIYDGATAIATGTATSTGGFSIVVPALAAGTHVFSASATDSTGAFFASKNNITYVYDNTKPTVSTVVQQDAQRLVVTFNKAVTAASATTAGNYTLNTGCGATNTLAGATFTQSTDKTSVTILETFAGRAVSPCGGTLNVQNLVDLAGNAQAAGGATTGFTFNDTTPPTLLSAAASAASGGTTTTATVTWNKAIQNPVNGTYSVDGIAVTAAINANPSKVNLTAIPAMAAGSTHNVCAQNEKDATGNTQSPNPQCVSMTVSTTTAAAPFVVSSAAQGGTDLIVKVTWNRDIDQTTPTLGAYASQYTSTGTATPANPVATADANNTAGVVLTFALATNPWTAAPCNAAGATSCGLTITVTGAKDSVANGNNLQNPPTQVFTVTLTKDSTKPIVSNVTANTPLAAGGVEGMTNIDILWSKPILAVDATKFTVTNGDSTNASCGATPCTSAAGAPNNLSATLQGDGVTVRLQRNGGASPFAAGTYTVSYAAAAVTDRSAAGNTNAASSATVTVVDATAPTLTAFAAEAGCAAGGGASCKVFTFTFSEAMKTGATAGSITDVNNYLLDNAALPAGSFITANAAATTATLTLPANVSVGGHNLVVRNVTDAAGVTLNPNPSANQGFTRNP